jgi:hypothetical protein
MPLTLISCTRNTDSAGHKIYLRNEIAAKAKSCGGNPFHFDNFTELYSFSAQPAGSEVFRTHDVLPIVEAQAVNQLNNCFDITSYIRNFASRAVRPIIICEVDISHSFGNGRYLGPRHKEVIAQGQRLGYGIICLEGDLDHKIQQIRALVPEQIEISLRHI